MKVTDAFWEKRNMGVETTEIKIEQNDSVEECRKVLQQIQAPYQVVKLPAAQIPLQNMLQEHGYKYMETIVRLKHDLKEDFMSPLQKRLAALVSYERMTEEDLEVLYREIDHGMFTTDRIILDDFFSEKQAHDRYRGWIGDELQKNGEAYKFIYKNKTIGFCVHRVEKEASYGILGGLYPEYSRTGLGFISLYSSIMIERARGAKCLISDVSTNNIGSLRNDVAMGFQIVDVENVFVKHCERES